MLKNDIGRKIYERRTSLGLTQKDVANYVGVTEATVSRWESGYIGNMRQNRIEKLAAILQVSPMYIMGIETANAAEFTSEQLELVNLYNELDDTGKKTLRSVLRALSNTYSQQMRSEALAPA